MEYTTVKSSVLIVQETVISNIMLNLIEHADTLFYKYFVNAICKKLMFAYAFHTVHAK